MNTPLEPAARGRRSLVIAVLFFAGGFGLVLPLIEGLRVLAFMDPRPLPEGWIWLRFAAVLAAAGTLLGAAMYLTARRVRGWPRSYVLGTTFALAIGARIEDFAARPPLVWAGRWVFTSLVTGLLLAWLLHLFASRINDRDPAR